MWAKREQQGGARSRPSLSSPLLSSSKLALSTRHFRADKDRRFPAKKQITDLLARPPAPRSFRLHCLAASLRCPATSAPRVTFTSRPSSSPPSPPPPVLATAEASPLIERLGLVEDPGRFSAAAPSKCFSGSYQGAAISVVTNGKCRRFGVDQIGTVAAGLSTWLSVEVRGKGGVTPRI